MCGGGEAGQCLVVSDHCNQRSKRRPTNSTNQIFKPPERTPKPKIHTHLLTPRPHTPSNSASRSSRAPHWRSASPQKCSRTPTRAPGWAPGRLRRARLGTGASAARRRSRAWSWLSTTTSNSSPSVSKSMVELLYESVPCAPSQPNIAPRADERRASPRLPLYIWYTDIYYRIQNALC